MSGNNIQILNYNHNIVDIGSDNKVVITDQIKSNSITIPQPVTNILQVNSPGPQGPLPSPIGPDGAIQFKSGSEFNGEQEFRYDYTNNSLQQGLNAIASGSYSHAEGLGIVALGDYQHTQGQYNKSSSNQSAFIVGNGTDDTNRSNLIFAVENTVQITGSLSISSVLNLAKSNPLPTGITGSLAVSGSHLYFHNGTSWVQAV